MLTKQEREEIAERLREVSTARTTDEVYVAILNCIGITYDYANLFNRLADLIDPTCELKIQDGHACCGNCGHILAGEYESEEDYWCFRPYCPDCGTRVVQD